MDKKEFREKWESCIITNDHVIIIDGFNTDLDQLINSIKENNKNRRLITDIPSTALFGNHGLKVCRCSNTEIRYRLYDNHTWEEVCIKCNAKSPSNHR